MSWHTARLGNSEAIAAKHYLQTTEEHFAQAQGGTGGGDKVAQLVETQLPEGSRSKLQQTQKASAVTALPPVFPEAFGSALVPPRGVESYPEMPRERRDSIKDGTRGGDIAFDLQALVDIWPTLTDKVRKIILTMAKCSVL